MHNITAHIKKLSLTHKEPTAVLSPPAEVFEDDSMIVASWQITSDVSSISIGLANKDVNDTIVDGDTIVSDLALQIVKITFNDIDLTSYLDYYGIYLTNNRQRLATHGYLGHNGTYTFKFRYNPLYMDMMCSLIHQRRNNDK